MTLRIVYASTLKPGLTDEDLAGLVDRAAAFNAAQGITGMMAVEDGRVCQILEGPDTELQALFSSIRRDPRHFGVTELVHVPIDRTTFEEWGMVRRPMADMVIVAFTL